MGRLLSLYATPATLVLVRVSGAVAAFLTSLILARNMDQADMGSAYTFVSLAIILGLLPTAGMEAGAVRFLAKYRKSEDHGKARGFVKLTRQIVGVSCIVILVLALAFYATGAFGGSVVVPIVLVAACVTGALRVGAAHAMGFSKVVRSQMPLTFLRQTGFLLAVLLMISLWETLTIVGVLLAFLCGSLIAFSAQIILLRGIDGSLGEARPDRSDWREWALYGVQMAPTLTFVQFTRDLILLIAAVSLMPEDVAILAVATAIVGFVKFGVVAINQSITPKMARLVAEEDYTALKRLVDVSNQMKFWPVLLAFVALWLLGPSILGLFGPGFSGATPILLILMLEPLALVIFGPSGQYISLSGQQAVMIPLAVVAILGMAIAITLGAWAYGLTGAALGAGVTWLGWSAMLAYYVRRTKDLDLTLFATFSNALPGDRT